MAKKKDETETDMSMESTEAADMSIEAPNLDTPNAPNVRFVGRRKRNGEWTDKEAYPSISTPNIVFDGLPSPDEQKKGFYCERARDLIREFPNDYKPYYPEGINQLNEGE